MGAIPFKPLQMTPLFFFLPPPLLPFSFHGPAAQAHKIW